MLNKETIIRVTNRDNGRVGYTIPDLGNLHRSFESGETKDITMEELRKLSYLPGGMPILTDYLVLDNEEAIEELLHEVELEYRYTNEDIKILLEKGTIEEFEDCLNFAPEGVINILKNEAVKLQLNDIRKRELILEKTGFNVDSAIKINKESMTVENNNNQPVRKAATSTKEVAAENTGRKATTSTVKKYNVVKK